MTMAFVTHEWKEQFKGGYFSVEILNQNDLINFIYIVFEMKKFHLFVCLLKGNLD